MTNIYRNTLRSKSALKFDQLMATGPAIGAETDRNALKKISEDAHHHLYAVRRMYMNEAENMGFASRFTIFMLRSLESANADASSTTEEIKAEFPQIYARCGELRSIYLKIDSLCETIRSRSEVLRKQDEELKKDKVAQLPPLHRKAAQKAHELLSEVGSTFKIALTESIASKIRESVTRIAQLPTRGDKHQVLMRRAELLRFFDRKEYETKADLDSLISQYASARAHDLIAMFVEKNTLKLARILHAKGAPETISTLSMTHASVRSGMIEGTMHVAFKDGMEFNVRSQVVYKCSPNGNHFAQYPTTFHGVKVPGKAVVAKMSEQEICEACGVLPKSTPTPA